MQQLHSSVTRLHDAVAQQQQATSRLMEAVERAVKRAGATDLRLASLDQHAGDSAARLLNMVQTLSEIAKDIHTIAPGFSACQSDLRAVRDAVFSEVKRNRARLGH
jgi:hypothetical protein